MPKCTVLAMSKCVKHDEAWNTVLKHVDVEFWCGTRRCDAGTQCWVFKVNVKAVHFGARMLKRRPPGGGGHAKQDWKVAFWGGKCGWNGLKFLWDNPSLQANHFHMVASPGSSGAMHRHAKAPCPDWEVAMFHEAAKREWRGDNLTGKQPDTGFLHVSSCLFWSQ